MLSLYPPAHLHSPTTPLRGSPLGDPTPHSPISFSYLQGAESEYCGEAVNPKHLSLLERLMGYSSHYKPEAATEANLCAPLP